MKIMEYNDYNIADIPEEFLKNITELENSLSSKTNKEVVLIAYQYTDRAES
jgi:hypothetical protein